MKMRQINELHADLASFLLNCARKKHFLGGFVQKYYFLGGLCRNITVPSYCIAAILCRASFRVCAEILVFGRNIHLWIMIMICLIKIIIMVYYYPDDCHDPENDQDTLVPALPSSPADLPRECLPIRYWHRCYGFQHGSWLW